MIETGDIYIADLNDEVRRRVLVISNARFNTLSNRVLVAPECPIDPDAVQFPWMVPIDGAVYAVNLLRSLSADRLLDRISRAPADAMRSVRQALLHIT